MDDIAVALKYLLESDEAPRVIAKGRGTVAKKLIAIARKHGVPIRTNSDLARALIKVELYESIPPDLYKAVAEIIAYIYVVEKTLK